MKIIGKPYKFLPWQITKIESDEGTIRIQIKKYFKRRDGGYDYNQFRAIYCTVPEWSLLKKEIKESMRGRNT